MSTPAYLFVDPSTGTASRDRSNEKKWVATAYRLRVGEQIPLRPHPLADANIVPGPEGSAIKEFLRLQFCLRPCWFKKSLSERCSVYLKQCGLRVTAHAITNAMAYLLPLFAFTYTSGPWMGLWVKLGFDPQREKEVLPPAVSTHAPLCHCPHPPMYSTQSVTCDAL